jgi:peptide/nickel transport system permease protein
MFIIGVLAGLVGVVIGACSGYFRGWPEAVLMRFTDIVIIIPVVLAAATLGQAVNRYVGSGAQIWLLGLFLGLVLWTGLARLVRGEFLTLREREFVDAAKIAGASNRRIIFKHILPNVFHLVIIDFTLGIVAFVQAEVILSFLGLGVTDQPSWGVMIDDAKLELMRSVWWQFAGATAAIFVLSLCLSFLGDALRDALDPRLRGVD